MREALGPVGEVLEAGRREGLAPGLSAVVLLEGRPVHRSVHGEAQVEPARRPRAPGCHFDVASLTKVMATGTLAARLVAAGALDLEAPVTVRKISYGVGVERIFPLHSPNIDRIEVLTRGKVRRARLYYMRKLRGKAARIKERRG